MRIAKGAGRARLASFFASLLSHLLLGPRFDSAFFSDLLTFGHSFFSD